MSRTSCGGCDSTPSPANRESAFRVVLEASLEVRSAVVYGSLIVVLVFLPVFFLGGSPGTFFRPLALSYMLAILASLFVALTLTPALSLLLLPGRAERDGGAAPRPLPEGTLSRASFPASSDRPSARLGTLLWPWR